MKKTANFSTAVQGLTLFLFVIMLYFPTQVFATDENIGPFSLGIGKTQFDDIKQTLDAWDCDYNATSNITNGIFASCPAKSFEFNGLVGNVIFIFDDKKTLDAASLTMRKDIFDSIITSLKAKYKLVKHQRPFVGNAYAKFVKNQVNIAVDAPHMSFEMSVIYSTESFDKRLVQMQQDEQQQKKKRQQDQL